MTMIKPFSSIENGLFFLYEEISCDRLPDEVHTALLGM